MLAVASRKGLLAAAGPDTVIVASTDSVRQAFSAQGSGDGQIKPYNPQLTINLGTRVSQVAFSADENELVISAENGGGLAIYSVEALMKGNTQVEFELSTNGIPLRAMVPNPTPEKAELFALVTTDGKLLVANLQTRQFLSSVQGQGQILREGVSCVSWSNRGKQLVAGFGNGSCLQMTPEGDAKAEIPRPSTLEGDQHGKKPRYLTSRYDALTELLVTSISWFENNLFLIAHTSSLADHAAPVSIKFHLVTRNPQSPNSFGFQKLPEVCTSFGSSRLPPFCSMQRLKDFPPSIQDLIIVVSTASADVGLFTRATVSLTNESDPQKVTNTFSATVIAEDARRASLPIQTSGEGSDTSCIGVAIDLSSNQKVKKPLPREDLEESGGPLPGLMILNEEGILSLWWIVYADSIRQNTGYPGLINGAAQQPLPQSSLQDPSMARLGSKPASSFGLPSFGGNATISTMGNGFGKPSAPGFGIPSVPTSGFSGSFGTSAGLGKPQSPWGSASQQTTAAFGQPAFGSPSVIGGTAQGTAFGAIGGNRAPLWGAQPVGSASASGSIFGQTGGLGGGSGSPGTALAFGVPAGNTGGFASFAKSPGFAEAAIQGGGGASVFGKVNPGTSLGSGMETDNSFGGTPKRTEASEGLFKGEGFKLGSLFKGDGTAADDRAKPSTDKSSSLLDSSFAQSLGESQKSEPTATSQEAQMNDDMSDYGTKNPSPIERKSMSPVAKPTAPAAQFPASTLPITGGLFGTQAQIGNTPVVSESSALMSSPPNPVATSTTPLDTPRKSAESAPSHTIGSDQKENRGSLEQISNTLPQDPLPPETISRVSYTAGDTSNSSKTSAEDAPLPPDFLPPKRNRQESQAIPPEPLVPLEDNEDDGLDDQNDDRSDDERSKSEESQEGSDDDQGRVDDDHEGRSDVDEGRLDDDEGSGVDVAQELSPLTDPTQSPKISPESSFGALAGKTPSKEHFAIFQQDQPHQGKKSLFGEVGSTSPAFAFLPPVSKEQKSPRSPSPARRLVTAENLRPDHARSFSAPGAPAKAIGARRKVLGRPTNEQLPPSFQQKRRNQEHNLRVMRQMQNAVEEEQDLSDREDEKVREELATPAEPSRDLETFLAHQDYVGAISKAGVPGQIEAVYRDINSMIDTLGLNARSLKSFVMWHKEFSRDRARSLEDLEAPLDWNVSEVVDLRSLGRETLQKLEDGRTSEVQEKLNICREMRKELHKIRAKRREVTKAIGAKSEQLEAESMRSAPLDLHQSAIQLELRRDFSKVQKQLAKAEEAISTLRVKLASQEGPNGNGKSSASKKKPTVEAVTNTIKKMTGMAEKKNLDIDVLEVHMRRLGFSPAPATATENKNSSSPSLHTSSPFTPKSFNGVTPHDNDFKYNHINNLGSSPRKSIMNNSSSSSGMMTNEAIERYKSKLKHRKAIAAIMRKQYGENGPRVRGLET